MKTWKTNLEETKQRYINWWNHKGIILSMWEHFSGRRETARRHCSTCSGKGFVAEVVRPSMAGGISGLVCRSQ